ncbi:MAG: hypothetical protein EP312_07640 [Gammaproteobacteria bacterium]|nr:MAG: hypothetical protein EP312_07640 [Gammaproteobacteria bacterium]
MAAVSSLVEVIVMKRIQKAQPQRWRQTAQPSIDDGRILRLMDKLTLEINSLNNNLRRLEGSGQRDLSAEQTCREMIRSRERLYRRLSVAGPLYRA